MDPLVSLETDIQRFDLVLDRGDWEPIPQRCSDMLILSGDAIQTQARVADACIFLSDGIAAPVQSWVTGASTIASFFETRHICANFISAWTGDVASDDLVALTDVAGVSIPNGIFRHEHLQGGFSAPISGSR